MIELIDRTISLANQPPLSTADSLERATDWMDALEPSIPVDRLPDAFARALKDHETSFPVNCFDIIAAWKKVAIEDAAKARELESQADPIETCKDRGLHVTEDGEVNYVDPTDTTKDICLPCRTCRPVAWEAARDRHIQKQPIRKPLELVTDFVPPIPPQLVIPDTPFEEATKMRLQFQALMKTAPTKAAYDGYERAYDFWGEKLQALLDGDAA